MPNFFRCSSINEPKTICRWPNERGMKENQHREGTKFSFTCFFSSYFSASRWSRTLIQVSLCYNVVAAVAAPLSMFSKFVRLFRVKVLRLAIRYVAIFYCRIFVLKTNRRKYTNKFYENVPFRCCLRRRRVAAVVFVVSSVLLFSFCECLYSVVYLPLNAIVIVHFLRSVIFTFRMFVDILLSPRLALFREWEHSAPIQRNGLQCALLSHHHHHRWCSCSDC